MSCDEGYSFNAEAVNMYGCGPDTNWKWNDMENLVVPSCSSTQEVFVKVNLYLCFKIISGEPGTVTVKRAEP